MNHISGAETRKKKLSAFLLFVLAVISGQKWICAETFVIPHFTSGSLGVSGFLDNTVTTQITVVNLARAEISVSMEAFSNEGSKLDMMPLSKPKIAPFGLEQYILVFFSNTNLASGWLRIITSGPAIVRGSLFFHQVDNGPHPPSPFQLILADAVIDPMESLASASVPVSFLASPIQNISTGIAIAFPSSGTSEGLFSAVLLGADGTKIEEQEVKVPANGHKAFLIEELFPKIKEIPEPGIGFVKAASLNLISKTGSPFYGLAIEVKSGPLQLIQFKTVNFGKVQ